LSFFAVALRSFLFFIISDLDLPHFNSVFSYSVQSQTRAALARTLSQLSQALDTQAACGYVTLVNLARKRRQEPTQPEEEKEEEGAVSQSPSAQTLGNKRDRVKGTGTGKFVGYRYWYYIKVAPISELRSAAPQKYTDS